MGIGNWLLNGIEKAGNKLPDPVFIFVWLIAILIGRQRRRHLRGLGGGQPRSPANPSSPKACCHRTTSAGCWWRCRAP